MRWDTMPTYSEAGAGPVWRAGSGHASSVAGLSRQSHVGALEVDQPKGGWRGDIADIKTASIALRGGMNWIKAGTLITALKTSPVQT